MRSMKLQLLLAVLGLVSQVFAANPYLPLWEFIPDGEPYVFDDPDHPGKKRVYVYGSHDSLRSEYCGRDQVVWSAPVENLKDWRFDGVIFRSMSDANGDPLGKSGVADILYAPDVAEKTGPDGKKTYYLYPNATSNGRRNMVAKSDRPDGPFAVCNWDPKNPKRTVGPLGFDPAVLVDDDGRVYGYWGFRRSYAAELDPETMATLKKGAKVVENMISGEKEPGEFRFFEASSIRKIRGKYVFIYSRFTKDGEFGLDITNYTLAYAYSDHPLGPWTYGGTVIDARARETRPDGRTVVTATPGGNTHGGICEINGQWWVFYHRQTGTDQFSRQAMVAPITVEVEEGPGGKVKISEGEYTSEGFETGGLDPFARQAAGIACYYTGPAGTKRSYPSFVYSGPYNRPYYCDLYRQLRKQWDPCFNRCEVVHITSGSVVGYKYFNFDRTSGRKGLKLELNLVPQGLDGAVEVWAKRPNAAEGGVKVGSFRVSADWPDSMRKVEVDVAPLADVKGKAALFFTFESPVRDHSICELYDFRFRAE